MTAAPDDTTTDLHAVIAELRAERDAALAREATLTKELAAQAAEKAARTAGLADRKIEFDERIEHQVATIDVLRAMSASPGDTLPVFNLITRRAAELCESSAALYELRDGQLNHMAGHGMSLETLAAFRQSFPRPLDRSLVAGRAILERRIIHVPNIAADAALSQLVRDLGGTAIVAIPLLRGSEPIGAIALNGRQPDGFSESQIALLQTFAEQAVIAITSAETYRALQTRTSDLQETLEYQTATSDVLKVISRSTFDLQPVLSMVAETAARLCLADQAAVYRYEGDSFGLIANFGWPRDYETRQREVGRYHVRATSPGIPHRAIIERRAIHIHDVTTIPDYPEVAINLGKERTGLGVPLLREGEPVGVIVLARQRVEPFTDRQIELVSTFADQAVIAIENTRLMTEQREALEQQTATAELLQIINSSPGDPAPVFDAMLDKALRLCGAAFGALRTFDGEALRQVASRNLPPRYAEYWNRELRLGPTNTVLAAAVLEQRIVQIEDMAADESYRAGSSDIAIAGVELGGVRTLVHVPLIKDSATLGVLTVFRQEVMAFSDKELALLQNFAAQAVIAMENARLLTEQREALEQQTATAEVLQVINTNPGDLTPVFDAILDKAHTLCGAVIGSLVLFDGTHFRAVATHGLPEQVASLMQHPVPPNSRTQELIDGMRFRQIEDIRAIRINGDYQIMRALVEYTDMRTVLFVPLRKDGALRGFISAYRPEVRAFSDKEIALLENFAAQAVIATENARLLTEQREALEQQTATAEVLQVINSSPGNLAPVFQAMLDKATKLCSAAFGILWHFDNKMAWPEALHQVPAGFAEFWREPGQVSPQSGPGRMMRGENAQAFTDIAKLPLYAAGDPATRAIVDLAGARSSMIAPLRKDNVTLGAITIYRQEVRPFTDKEITLLENFAAQAVIAMENARLLTELRQRTEELAQRNSEYGERIEQQSATIEVLEAMSASPGDAQPVFQVIVERARAFCNADNANLALVRGDMLHLQATTIGSDATAMSAAERADYMTRFPRPVDATSLFGRAVLTRTAVQTPDVRSDPQHFTKHNAGETMVRALVAVPLLRAGVPMGAIVLARDTPGEFSSTQIELLQTFAEQAVIAISSAEIFKELQRRTADLARSVAELQALEEVLRAVNSSLELETVLSTIISRAVRLSAADEGTIYEFDDAEQVFVPKSAYGMTDERVAALRNRRIRIGETPLGNSAAMRAPLHISDLTQTLDIDGSRGLVEAGIHALLAVPLLRDEKVLGGLVIRRRAAGGFAPTVPALLQTFAGQCVLAIENARLFRDARQARIEAEGALADLRRTQDRLVHSEKMASLGQLTAGIAHEIKNPLNFVNNFAELSGDLLDELNDAVAGKRQAEIDELTATLQGNLAKIAEHGKRADGIVKAMLEHSRGSSGERRMVDLNALIDEALNLAYHGARAQDQSFNVTLERDFAEGIAPIELAPQDMTRVFLNLFGNGFYAATRRARNSADAGFMPTLKVTSRDVGDAVEVRVRDNGIGISSDIKDKLFQPFFTTKPTGEGTGLGLSITYDIVTQQHGGSIAVDSEVGEYSEFTIRVPRNP